MSHILIVDPFKSSIVMTSEIIKDHYSNSSIRVVNTGSECFNSVEKDTPKLIIIDFDLPDTDGVTLGKLLRRVFTGPILLTAFPDDVVTKAVKVEQYFYSDISNWIKKPVKKQQLCSMLDAYLMKNKEIFKRFSADLTTEIIRNKADLRKNNHKAIQGRVLDISIDSVGVRLDSEISQDLGDQFSLKLSSLIRKTNKKLEGAKSLKVKGKLLSIDKEKNIANIKFCNLSLKSVKGLEGILRESKVID